MTETTRERWSDSKLEIFYQEFREYTERFERHTAEEVQMVSSFLKAFPNEDPVKHRLYHEAVMRAAEEQEKFWRELRLDIAKKSMWGLVMLILGFIGVGALAKVKGMLP